MRDYTELVKEYLPQVKWMPEGEKFLAGRVTPVYWHSPTDFYFFVNGLFGDMFEFGLFLKDYVGEENLTVAEEKLSKQLEIAELAKETDVLGEVGVSKGTKIENSTFIRGTTKKYRIAKLKRDHPEIAQRLMDGEFKSVSAAERVAGIGKALQTPVEKLITAYGKLTDTEKDEFITLTNTTTK